MPPLIKGANAITGDNLEAVLALLGMYSLPGQLIAPKFSDISSFLATTDAGYQVAGPGQMQNGGTTSFSVDLLRIVPFFVPKTIHIDRIAFVVTTVGGAGSKARCGIYNTQQTAPFLPTTLVVDGGEFDTTALNGKISTVDVTLQGGTVYASAYLPGTAAPTIASLVTVGLFPFLGYQISASATTTTLSQGLSAGLAYGALPLTLTNITQASYSLSGNVPAIFYRPN